MPVSIICLLAAIILVALIVFHKRSSDPGPRLRDPEADVLYNLRQLGSDFTQPHPIEFFLNFPTRQGADAAARQLMLRGYSAQVECTPGGLPWVCFAVRHMRPEYTELVRIRYELSELAELYGGEYDGWGSPVIPKFPDVLSGLRNKLRLRKFGPPTDESDR